VTEQQAQDLLRAAIAWQEQGARSKWKTETSLALWDTVDRIKREQAQDSEFLPPLRIEQFIVSLLNRLVHRLLDAVTS